MGMIATLIFLKILTGRLMQTVSINDKQWRWMKTICLFPDFVPGCVPLTKATLHLNAAWKYKQEPNIYGILLHDELIHVRIDYFMRKSNLKSTSCIYATTKAQNSCPI